MSSEISSENERFIQHAIEAGTFRDRNEALDTAVELLRRRQRLIDDVNDGIELLERGEAEPLDIEAIKATVRVRLKEVESRQH